MRKEKCKEHFKVKAEISSFFRRFQFVFFFVSFCFEEIGQFLIQYLKEVEQIKKFTCFYLSYEN